MLFANMGIPMICVTLPAMLVALLPIALCEAFVYWRLLGRTLRDAFSNSLVANLWSTILGIPLTWLIVMIGQGVIGGSGAWEMDTPDQRWAAVTLQAAWLIPYGEHLGWMIPAASLVLLLPYWFGSVLIEYIALGFMWPRLNRRELFLSIVIANAVSYCGLGSIYAIQLWFVVQSQLATSL